MKNHSFTQKWLKKKAASHHYDPDVLLDLYRRDPALPEVNPRTFRDYVWRLKLAAIDQGEVIDQAELEEDLDDIRETLAAESAAARAFFSNE